MKPDLALIDENFASLEDPLAGFPGFALSASMHALKQLDLETFCARFNIFRGEVIVTAHISWLTVFCLVNERIKYGPEVEACGRPFWLTEAGREHLRDCLAHVYQQAVAFAGDDLRIRPNLGSHLNYMEAQAQNLISVLLQIMPHAEAA